MDKKKRKKGYRSVFRELMLLLLYQWEFRKEHGSVDELVDMFFKNKRHRFLKALRERMKEITEKSEELDALIRTYSKWPWERVDLIDKLIMRIAAFEMIYKDVPPEIAISEALKLSSKFSSVNSYKFINAVLEKVKEDVVSKTTQNSHSGKTQRG